MRRIILLLSVIIVSVLGLCIYGRPDTAQASNGTEDIIVQTIPGPTVAQKLTDRTKGSWPWYVVRGSGLMAAVALVLLMFSGVGLVTGYTFRFLEPLTAWASHRALGIMFGVAVFVHMFTLLFDKFQSYNIWQILVPWLSKYKPVTIVGIHLGSLYVALGVLSFYVVGLIVLTSLFWVEKKPYLWKLVHLLSYLLILFIFVHALYLGTDLAHGFLRWLWIITGIGIVIASLHRLWRAKTV